MADRRQTSVRFSPELLARIDEKARERVIGRNLLITRLIEIGLQALDPLPDLPESSYAPGAFPIPVDRSFPQPPGDKP